MATVGDVLDSLLRGDGDGDSSGSDADRRALQWLVEKVSAAEEGDKWSAVRDVTVEAARNKIVRDAIVARFNPQLAILVEALLLYVQEEKCCVMQRYQAELRGAGFFPLEKMVPSVRDATMAVCAALNTDFQRLRAHPDAVDAQSQVLLRAFSNLVDDWALEPSWHTRLCDAALLPDPERGCTDGEFALCADDAIHFVCQGDASPPCVRVTPFDLAAKLDECYYVLDVSPVPRGPWPLWLTESDTVMGMGTWQLTPPRPEETFAFTTVYAAHRARTYFRLMSATVSNVYTVAKTVSVAAAAASAAATPL
jgi:hypothetical protein